MQGIVDELVESIFHGIKIVVRGDGMLGDSISKSNTIKYVGDFTWRRHFSEFLRAG
jgi:hypothetical protein